MKRGISFPLILGHEGAGIVESVGGAVRSLRSGDRVACTQWTEPCGRCRFCRTNREPLCAERKFFGHDRDGTYAEYFKIQEDSLLPLPASIPFGEGAILSCAVGTVLAAIRGVGARRPASTSWSPAPAAASGARHPGGQALRRHRHRPDDVAREG